MPRDCTSPARDASSALPDFSRVRIPCLPREWRWRSGLEKEQIRSSSYIWRCWVWSTQREREAGVCRDLQPRNDPLGFRVNIHFSKGLTVGINFTAHRRLGTFFFPSAYLQLARLAQRFPDRCRIIRDWTCVNACGSVTRELFGGYWSNIF